MQYWEREVPTITKAEIAKYCVRNRKWIQFRENLNGLTTGAKLTCLHQWLSSHNEAHSAQVQVAQYIHVLKRGKRLRVEYHLGTFGIYRTVLHVCT